MNYEEWCRWLETRNPSPLIAPGLERMTEALEHCGLLPQFTEAHVIHIAGTNGKGTTARTLEHLLLAASESVGLYTSPHLVTTAERIRANGHMISEKDFSSLCEKHLSTIEKFNLSHFESLTLIACDYFLNIQNTKWMIFEIGLGGTWDATNAIPHSTSVLTTIGMDHMHILGNTLEEIASNKFGIIHDKNTVIARPFSERLQPLLEKKVKDKNATLISVKDISFRVCADLVPRYMLQLNDSEIEIHLPGKRAVENISLAVTTFEQLGFSLDAMKTLCDISWPARMTPLSVPESPCPIYLSGDHNIQGIESLIEILQKSTYETITLILGLSKNRSHREFIEKLSTLRNSTLLLTKPEFQGVLPSPEETTLFIEDQQEALQQAYMGKTAKDLVVITGSLYLCGDYLRRAVSAQPNFV
jgi:dihydrofolate synthase / folylpolyglutamate synthase